MTGTGTVRDPPTTSRLPNAAVSATRTRVLVVRRAGPDAPPSFDRRDTPMTPAITASTASTEVTAATRAMVAHRLRFMSMRRPRVPDRSGRLAA